MRDALVAAGVARVVIGVADPLERDRAQGGEVLRAAGIDVAVANGADAAACAELNAGFLTWAATGLPHVTLKLATSLDGKLATAGGESRWISGPEARAWCTAGAPTTTPSGSASARRSPTTRSSPPGTSTGQFANRPGCCSTRRRGCPCARPLCTARPSTA